MQVIMCPDRQQPAMHNANFVFPCPGKTCSTINSLCTKRLLHQIFRFYLELILKIPNQYRWSVQVFLRLPIFSELNI